MPHEDIKELEDLSRKIKLFLPPNLIQSSSSKSHIGQTNLKFSIINFSISFAQLASINVRLPVVISICIIGLKLPPKSYLFSIETTYLPISKVDKIGVAYFGNKNGASNNPYLIIIVVSHKKYQSSIPIILNSSLSFNPS